MQGEGKTIRDYVYSSETKIREKLSLKNLLADEPGLERNFLSQQSQRGYRTTARPQTMYGQRVKMFLNDETKKVKIQTEIKMRRQQSSYKVTKSNSGVQIRSITNQDKIRMKKALGRINVLAQGTSLIRLQEQQEIESIFHFIGCLSQVDNHYQTAFKYLMKRLKELVFANPASDMGLEIRNLADSTKNEALIKFSYRNLGKTTFASLCKELLKETERTVMKMHEALKKQTSGQQKNLQLIKQKQELIKKLKRELKYYQEHPSQDLYPYVKKLQRENKQLKQQIQQLLHVKNQNEYSIQIHQTSNLLLSQQIQSLKARIYEMELQELSGMKQAEKNSELKMFQENIQNLKDMLQKSKLKMQGMKEEYDRVREQNEQLINQRSLLAKRAAVGFGELTPRPNIKAIFNQNNLIYEDHVHLSQKNTTTENIMKAVVKRIRILEHSKGHKAEETKQVVEDRFQEQDQMQNAINFIDQTKMQVKKTSDSVDQIKKSFNRQKSDRESLQKNNKGKK